jgi:excisionase family DNA binding protein
MGDAMEQLMTIDEVADYMQVSRFTVYRLVKSRQIPGTKIGRQWRFHKEEINRWLKEKSEGR